ncbi:MAG: hypothetical protein U1F43_13900 [Myxococcota bacterium]
MRVAPIVVVVFVGALLGSSAGSAMAGEPCERGALLNILARLPGSAALKVERAVHVTRLVDVATKKVVLEATCHGVSIPASEGLEAAQPDKRAATRTDGRYTVSRSARGALSLGIAAGLAANDAIEVLAFDDDSVSLTDGRGRVWYSAVTKADGTLVEVEGAHVGCGCERTTAPDGKVPLRKL